MQPTEEELAEERWKGICSAMDDVNDLLQIPALAANAKRFIFELTRCYMFKGELSKVLQGCCTAATERDLEHDAVPLREFLVEKAETTVHEIVTQGLDSEHEIMRCLNIIKRHLRKGSDLSYGLLFELAATMSVPTRTHREDPPALPSILQRQPVWQELFQRCVRRPSEPRAAASRVPR